MAHQRYTVQQVIAALMATKGMQFLAAKQLGCSHDTIQRYIQRYPSVKAASAAQRGEMVDVTELKLWAAIQRDEAWAIALCLRTLGRARGYVVQQEVKDVSEAHGLASLLRQAQEMQRNGDGPP